MHHETTLGALFRANDMSYLAILLTLVKFKNLYALFVIDIIFMKRPKTFLPKWSWRRDRLAKATSPYCNSGSKITD